MRRSLDTRCLLYAGLCWAMLVPPFVFADADKIIIAHRGASAYLPEHTLEAYAMAYAFGADYIEPDLVRTQDGVFIALHDIHLEATTDVETQFPDRKRDDGRWYAADFTLEEIRRLKVHERLNGRFPKGKSSFQIPTFEEVIELVQGLNASTGRDVGIYPELKSPSWHAKANLPMEEAFLEIVTRYGYAGPKAKIFIQCFEPPALQKIRLELKCGLPSIQLISGGRTQDYLVTDAGLDEVAAYANGIGPDKGRIEKDPSLVQRAHARSLKVHPYTLRKDTLPPQYDTFYGELRQFYVTYDVDGLFTDFPDQAVAFLQGLRVTQN